VKLQVFYAPTPTTGYGRMSIELVRALERAGVHVVHNGAPDDTASHVIFMSPPQRPNGWFKGQHVSLLTMWESTQLAMEHLTTVPLYDHVFVPSEQNLLMFGKVNHNTTKFCLGCDYDRWSITTRVMSDPFTIITGGKGGRRKGIDIAIKVFKRFAEWCGKNSHPAPRLIIKGNVNLAYPRSDIIVLDHEMSEEDEAKLYAQSHVYLGLARGEGWGMIPHQTIAQGMPTILSNAHGHAEFAEYGLKVSCGFTPAETDIVGRSGDWWEPSEDEALAQLKVVYKSYQAHAIRAEKKAKEIRKKFTWDIAAQQILEHLPEAKSGKRGKWIECPQTHLSMRVTEPIACTIAGESLSFRQGKDYKVTADVKRVLYDAGFVDPKCLDPYEKALYETPRPFYMDEETA